MNQTPTEIKRGRPRRTNIQGSNTQSDILQAARRVIVEKGVELLSMDRVAKEAGVAKGTLLYHYPTKEKLLMELMKNYTEHLESCLLAGMNKCRHTTNPLASGFSAWFKDFYAQDRTYTSFGLAILSYAAHNPKFREPVRRWYESLFEKLRVGNDPDEAIFCVLALEGLFYLQHFDLNVLTPKEIEQVTERVSERFKD